MSNNEFEDVQKQDVKNSKGFYLFMAVWVIASVAWLALGGAQDGAWWALGVGVAILIINAVGNWASRNEGKQ